jgi:anti-sigma regulatory factor (Ser/Thr protein kinase)
MTDSRSVPLRIANLAKGLLYLGQVYADPRDALNEFVSNAADEYAQGGRRGGIIRIALRRASREPEIIVSDAGRGMTRQRLEEVAGSLCESEKARAQEAERIIGEKGIGILGFASIAEQCDIVTRREGEPITWQMRLRRGAETCEIGEESERTRSEPGTDVRLTGIGKDTWRVLTVPKLSEYFRLRRRQALLAGDYGIELVEGRKSAIVRPEIYRGIPYEVEPVRTAHGQIRIHLYLWPAPGPGRAISVVGKGGTTVVDDLSSLDEFGRRPWDTGQVQGEVIYPALEQTTGRKGIVRDAPSFAILAGALRGLEDGLNEELRRITQEHRERMDREMFLRLREIFAQVMRELRDFDNPMRVSVSDPKGDPGPGSAGEDRVPGGRGANESEGTSRPSVEAVDSEGSGAIRQRQRPLPTWRLLAFPEEKRHLRSELDPDTRVIRVNELHPDYRVTRDDPAAQLHYLMTLTAKELALWQNPATDAVAAAEDMIRILVRARRYLPERA